MVVVVVGSVRGEELHRLPLEYTQWLAAGLVGQSPRNKARRVTSIAIIYEDNSNGRELDMLHFSVTN